MGDLNVGPPGSTGERFERVVYVGYQPGRRGPQWVVRTASGWTLPLESAIQNDPAGGDAIRRRVIGQTYGLYSLTPAPPG